MLKDKQLFIILCVGSDLGFLVLRNLHCRFILCSASQIYGGDFSKFCGLLRMYELY